MDKSQLLQTTIINHVIDKFDAQQMRRVLFSYMEMRFDFMYRSQEDLITLIKEEYPELSHLTDNPETVCS